MTRGIPGMSCSMKRFPSIKTTEEFRRVYETGRSRANRFLVVYVLKNGSESSRLGVSASKKIGNSVVRHHMTRLLRETFRLHLKEIRGGYDIVAVVRPAAVGHSFSEIEKAYLHLLQLHGSVGALKGASATVEVLC